MWAESFTLHAAKVIESSLPVVMCLRCGAYCTGAPRKLPEPCGKVYAQQRRQFLRGDLPWPRGLKITSPWPLHLAPQEEAEWWARLM